MIHLVWVLRHPLHKLVAKGEIIPRYYNPGDVADKITFLSMGEELFGGHGALLGCARAQVNIIRLPQWAKVWPGRVKLPDLGHVDLVRAGAGPEGVIACRLGARCNVALSLHADRQEVLDRTPWPARWRARRDLDYVKRSLAQADRTAHVYRSLESYDPHGVLLYNMVAQPPTLGTVPGRIVCVGAQDQWRDPRPLIEALALLPEPWHLVMIGDGPLREAARQMATDLGVWKRITWYRALPNREALEILASAQVAWSAATHNGIGKPHLEALAAGKPIVAPWQGRVPELGDTCWQNEDCEDRAIFTLSALPGRGQAWYQANYGSPAAAEERWRAWMWD